MGVSNVFKEKFENYDYVDGGVCSPKGFVANGVNCGLRSDKRKNDLAMIFSETVCDTAIVYTQNKVKGAPLTVTKKHMDKSNGKSRAIIVNSKNANTCNANGEEIAEGVSELVAKALGIPTEQVVVGSTGVIGKVIEIEPFANHMEDLVKGLSAAGNEEAAKAIMTTDTIKKEVAVEFKINDVTCRIGGMAKGSGMICPNMATTLSYITTDAAIDQKLLSDILKETVNCTYNCLSIDRDTSTNDMVVVMANGLAGNDMIYTKDDICEVFKKALYIVMLYLTRMLAIDGEGASKFLECSCVGASDVKTSVKIAKSVVSSSLVKCLLYGEDANWGRIMCALGYADCEYDINKVKVSIESEYGKIDICDGDAIIIPFSEEEAAKLLSAKKIYISIDLCQGSKEAKAWGCDLTYDYVKINGDYRT